METFPWEQVIASVLQIAIAALLMERALALVFEQAWFVQKLQGKGIKEFVAFAVAWGICKTWDVDVFAQIFVHPHSHRIGTILSAMTLAGGSKVSQTLFELWNIKSSAARAAANGGTK